MCAAFSLFMCLLAAVSSLHGLGNTNVSSTQALTLTSAKTKRKRSNEMAEPISAESIGSNAVAEPISAKSIINAAILLGDNIREVAKELSKSIGAEMIIQQRVQELDGALGEIQGLTEDERDIALSKTPDHPRQLLVFFSLLPNRRLGWLRKFLSNH